MEGASMSRTSLLDHGTSDHEEDPVPSMVRKGWGTHIVGNPSFFVTSPDGSSGTWTGPASVRNWFHFAITSPILIDDVNPLLVRCYVLFLGLRAWVRAVHVWDGDRKVAEFDRSQINFTGDFTFIG